MPFVLHDPELEGSSRSCSSAELLIKSPQMSKFKQRDLSKMRFSRLDGYSASLAVYDEGTSLVITTAQTNVS